MKLSIRVSFSAANSAFVVLKHELYDALVPSSSTIALIELPLERMSRLLIKLAADHSAAFGAGELMLVEPWSSFSKFGD